MRTNETAPCFIEMKLVDTSAWIHHLRRKGLPVVRDRVDALLRAGQAAWCPVVRLELWNGVGSEHDRRILRDFERVLPALPITDEVWQAACDLADRCRESGKTAPMADVLIAACARHHGCEMEHADKHFDFLMTL